MLIRALMREDTSLSHWGIFNLSSVPVTIVFQDHGEAKSGDGINVFRSVFRVRGETIISDVPQRDCLPPKTAENRMNADFAALEEAGVDTGSILWSDIQ